MDNYFSKIINNLTLDDLKILGILNDHEAEVKFKAITKRQLCELSKFSTANFRKSLYRLEIANFIEIVTGQNEHKVFITPFGQKALFTSIQKEEL